MGYRDELKAAQQRIETLEAKLEASEAAVKARDAELAELRGALARATREAPPRRRWLPFAAAGALSVATAGMVVYLVTAPSEPRAFAAAPEIVPNGDDLPLTVPLAQVTHPVRYEVGVTELLPGDAIVIDEIIGDGSEIEMGGNYIVRGRYRLASHDAATLQLLVTAENGAEDVGTVAPHAVTAVTRGEGRFELRKHLRYDGYPRLTFYGEDGEPFGGIYFGTGPWLLRPGP